MKKTRTAGTPAHSRPEAVFRHYTALGAAALLLLLGTAACKKGEESNNGTALPRLGTCEPVTASGRLTYAAATRSYSYRTSGGGTVTIDSLGQVAIGHEDYPSFRLDFWGLVTINGRNRGSDAHESLNGKHIKDRQGAVRTILFPDGAKITFVADSVYGQLRSVSIYDGAECHHLNTGCNQLEYSGNSQSITRQLDDAQPDGEAAAFEFTADRLLFVNRYTEDTAGNKVANRVPLGEIYRSQPNRVDDYYDDPRRGDT